MPDHDPNFHTSAPNAPVSGEEIRQALDNLLRSRLFRAAHSQRKFLRYVVEETLAGRGSHIKEFTVALEAFGRDGKFDPRVDPIIRTEARKLRARLAKYYEEEGSGEAIRIELQRGSYIPRFSAAVPDEPRELAPTLEVEPEIPEVAAATPHPRIHDAIVPGIRSKFAAVVAFAACGVAILGLGLWVATRRGSEASRGNSLAVLPVLNHSGDPVYDAAAARITTSLTRRIQKDSGVRVAAYASVSGLSPDQLTVTQIRQRLQVNSLLTGSMEKAADTVRLRVRLSGPDGAPMWSGSYTFDVGLLQAIESEVAAEVIHVLRTGTPGQQSQRLSSRKAPNPAARAAHLEGLQSLRKLDTVSVGKAIEQFQTAVRLDRSFAEAWASLANAWVLAAQVSGIPPAEVSGKIRRYATQALQLDSSLGDPHFSLAICAEYEYDWPTAEREFLAGLALSPFSATGHLWYAKYLALTGRSREVLVHRTIGAELDPTSPYAIQSVAGYWSVAGEYRQAISGFRSALAIDPGFRLARQGLAIAYLLDGNPDRAIAELEAANRDEQGLRIRSLLGYTYARTGRLKEARAILAEFEERERRGPFPALAIAHIHIGLGDKDRAFAWLEKAVDQRDLSVTLQWDSLYVPLRSDERYHKLLRRMRLA